MPEETTPTTDSAAPSPSRVVVAGLQGAAGEAASATEQAEVALARRARVLRDAGTEVIWVGTVARADQVAAVAVAEDADRVEVAPPAQVPEVERALAQRDAADIAVSPVEASGSV